MPQLMMGFTADGQADPAMVAARDARLGVSSEDKRKRRADIAAPSIDAGADAWQKGKVIQIEDPTGGHAHAGRKAPTRRPTGTRMRRPRAAHQDGERGRRGQGQDVRRLLSRFDGQSPMGHWQHWVELYFPCQRVLRRTPGRLANSREPRVADGVMRAALPTAKKRSTWKLHQGAKG